jgi:hypothetical protein
VTFGGVGAGRRAGELDAVDDVAMKRGAGDPEASGGGQGVAQLLHDFIESRIVAEEFVETGRFEEGDFEIGEAFAFADLGDGHLAKGKFSLSSAFRCGHDNSRGSAACGILGFIEPPRTLRSGRRNQRPQLPGLVSTLSDFDRR